MELSFSSLRTKEVVNTKDGRKLGRVCDVALCYPENRWLGIVVPGTKGWGRKKNELFIDLKQIVKIGEDVILVNIGLPRGKESGKNGISGRSEPCPPSGNGCAPSCIPGGAPNGMPPPRGGGGYVAEPLGRNFEEYE